MPRQIQPFLFFGADLMQKGLAIWACTCAAFLFAGAATAHVEYAITDLGGNSTWGNGISASGLVTGWVDTPDGTSTHILLYDGTTHDLGIGFGRDAQGYAVNDKGHVAGIFIHVTAQAFFYDGVMHHFFDIDAGQSFANGINNSDEVVGEGGPGGGFLYDGTMHSLGQLPNGRFSGAYAINDYGQVTGYSDTGDSVHAMLWTPNSIHGTTGTMIDLGTLGGSQSYGFGISSNGVVCGTSNTPVTDLYSMLPISHAFLFDGAIHDLGTLGGNGSAASGVNARGQVVGSSYLGYYDQQRAFIYTAASAMVDLNSLIDPALGWELAAATGINDAGMITGYGYIGGVQHGFLLTPVPEPSAALLACTGLMVSMRRQPRRRPK